MFSDPPGGGHLETFRQALLLAKQEQRLNELEARIKKLEDALAV
jgi:BMFP domain-containing protein YqiC